MPLLQGEQGTKLQAQVCDHIVKALKQNVPEVDKLVYT